MDNRILVAATRGARLQYKKFGRWPWETTLLRPFVDPVHEWRVHPNDTELLYCKVGRALREAAENPPALLIDAFDMNTQSSPLARFNPCVSDWAGYRDADVETRRMFLLMMAEELSYEVLE